jgi:ribosome biogenesis ATPase
MCDFELGLLKVQPSARREGFATIPDVTWDEVGALQELRHELHHAIIEPINHPERFEALGLKPSCGVLLHGPPGCGKTLLAKAIANESGASFISVKGPELLNKYVGESERAVRQLFARGRASSPCVVFFDELDALVPRRGGDSSNQASERVVNQMLTEMDGLDGNKQLFVVAATNRPDMIDPAMLRPGRLDKLLYVPLPTPAAREDILRTASRKMPLDASVSLGSIARDRRCEGFSGADLSALAREAAVGALKACTGDTRPVVTSAHFEAAFSHVFPSVSPHEEANYLRAAERLRNARAKTGANTGARAKAEANGMGAAAPAAGGKHADGADGHGAAEGVPSGARGSGGLFGGAPAAAGGLFGGAPAAAGGLFGGAPAAAGGLFGGAPLGFPSRTRSLASALARSLARFVQQMR